MPMFSIASLTFSLALQDKNSPELRPGVAAVVRDTKVETKSVQGTEGCPEHIFPGNGYPPFIEAPEWLGGSLQWPLIGRGVPSVPTGPPCAGPRKVWVTLRSLLRAPLDVLTSHSAGPTPPSQFPKVNRECPQLITGGRGRPDLPQFRFPGKVRRTGTPGLPLMPAERLLQPLAPQPLRRPEEGLGHLMAPFLRLTFYRLFT